MSQTDTANERDTTSGAPQEYPGDRVGPSDVDVIDPESIENLLLDEESWIVGRDDQFQEATRMLQVALGDNRPPNLCFDNPRGLRSLSSPRQCVAPAPGDATDGRSVSTRSSPTTETSTYYGRTTANRLLQSVVYAQTSGESRRCHFVSWGAAVPSERNVCPNLSETVRVIYNHSI